MKARILSALFLVQFSILLGVLIGHSLWKATSAESPTAFLFPLVLFVGIIAFFSTIEED